MLYALKDCLRAYLSALKEDPEVVERVARANYNAHAYMENDDGETVWFDDLSAEWKDVHRKLARAALSAIEVE
jgi:hypothetical protein